jgi:hypothetical protein
VQREVHRNDAGGHPALPGEVDDRSSWRRYRGTSNLNDVDLGQCGSVEVGSCETSARRGFHCDLWPLWTRPEDGDAMEQRGTAMADDGPRAHSCCGDCGDLNRRWKGREEARADSVNPSGIHRAPQGRVGPSGRVGFDTATDLATRQYAHLVS